MPLAQAGSNGASSAAAAAAAPAGAVAPTHPAPSRRVRETDAPCIVKTKALVASTPGTLSLAQGIVYWAPPPQALATAAQLVSDPAVSAYGPDEGLPALREALRHKIEQENGLKGVSSRGWERPAANGQGSGGAVQEVGGRVAEGGGCGGREEVASGMG